MNMASIQAVPHIAEPVPDEALIERVGTGDEYAFNLLYERYFPRVHGFVRRRLRNPSDVEETVQEVFINVFNSMATFRGEAPFGAWVLGLTRRTIARRFKKKQHPTVPLVDDDSDGTDALSGGLQREASPLEHYEVQERLALIEQQAARSLSPEQRDLFERHHLQHESIQDIAAALHKSEDSVKSNLYRARKILFAS
jgi:RNA polymerase sigma-70 factor (ECF subfamily)